MIFYDWCYYLVLLLLYGEKKIAFEWKVFLSIFFLPSDEPRDGVKWVSA